MIKTGNNNIDRFITQTESNFASSRRSIKWTEVQRSFQSFWKTPLTYWWLIRFRSMLSIQSFPKNGGLVSPQSPRVFSHPLLPNDCKRLHHSLGAWNRLADDMCITPWMSRFRKLNFCMQFHTFIMHAEIPYSFKQIITLRWLDPVFLGGVPSYFEALWYPHIYFYRKSNTWNG